jgi:hypothetical protein
MTFRHTLSVWQFPGIVLRPGLHEGFVEVFEPQSETNGLLNVDEDITPPELAESYVGATTDITNRLASPSRFLSSTRSNTQCHSSKQNYGRRTLTDPT